MFKWILTAGLAEYGSAALVFVSAAVVGHEAAVGMNQSQWLAAAVSILGSVSVAVIVHVWPAKAKASAVRKARED
jgi:uncharacterized iron-regulated membrane protein